MKNLLLLSIIIIIFILTGCVKPNTVTFYSKVVYPDPALIEKVNTSTILFWETFNTEKDDYSYDIYLYKENEAPVLIKSGLTQNFLLLNDLLPNIKYYWKIITRNSNGLIQESEIMSFFTETSQFSECIFPLNESKQTNLEIPIVWPSIDGTNVLYDLYLDTNKFPEFKIGQTLDNYYTVSGLDSGITYYWRIIAKNTDNSVLFASSVYSFSTVNNTPQDFELLFPSDGAQNVTLTPILEWENAIDPDNDSIYYDVYIDTKPKSEPKNLYYENISVSKIKIMPLYNGIVYYWMVVAKDGKGGIKKSKIESFKTLNNGPIAGKYDSPLNDEENIPIQTVLKWKAATDSENDLIYYDVYLGNNEKNLKLISENQKETYFTTYPLLNNTKYFWKVVVKDNKGGESSGELWSFKTMSDQNIKIHNIYPLDNSDLVSINPIVKWELRNISSENFTYDLYLSTTNEPEKCLANNISDTYYRLMNLKNNTKYFWRITAKDLNGNMISSSIYSFKTLKAEPNKPVLIYPFGSDNEPSSGFIIWNMKDVDDVYKYSVFLGTKETELTEVASDLTATFYRYNKLLSNKIYFVCIKVTNSENTSNLSDIYSFMTSNNQPNDFSIISPMDKCNSLSNNLKLEWDLSIDPDGDKVVYDVYLDKSYEPYTLVAEGIESNNIYMTLEKGTKYYWKVVARDTNEARTSTAINSFITESPWKIVKDSTEFLPRDGAGLLSFKGKLWLLGGWKGDLGTSSEVWVSDNGENWDFISNAPWPARHGAGWIVFNNKIWVISGDGYEDVWNSEDGITWNLVSDKAPWGKRYTPYILVFNNKIWIMGGLNFWDDNGNFNHFTSAYNDVWNSEDGITWNLVTPHAAWAQRGLIHGGVIKDNKMWIMGGGIKGSYNGTLHSETLTEYNDVWNSEDGITWIRVVEHAPWSPRTHFSVTSYNNKIYITDGSVGTQMNLSNEVWYSENGIDWTQMEGIQWQNRHASSLIVHSNELYLIGGYLFNDVWKLSE